MRGARWLLLVAIVAILGGVGLTYRAQKKVIREQAPPKPKMLAEGLNSSAQLWHWRETDAKNNNRVTVDIWAENFNQVKDSSRVDLKKVTLNLYHKDGKSYDLVKSDAAAFFSNEHRLYSDGAVLITLDMPLPRCDQLPDERHGACLPPSQYVPPKRTPVSVQSSGVSFNTDTGRAETDRASTFTFSNGYGKATGAFYDPPSHELLMKSNVEIHYTSDGPNRTPMKIEAGSLTYHEANAEILLQPWGRLTRGSLVVEGQNPVIHLHNHEIQDVHATDAHGTEDDGTRKVQYSAEDLWMGFNEKGQLTKIVGQTNARLLSDAPGSQTIVTANHVDLDFEVHADQSQLMHVAATGQAVVTSRPLPLPGKELTETHILRSDNLEMQMKPGGKEIYEVVTHAPGNLEFLPNLPTQHHRILNGANMVILYGADNRISTFRATDVLTVTDPSAEEAKHNRAQSITSSKTLLAHFDPQTSHISTMEQTGDFKYREGDRQARAAKATLDSDRNIIVLETGARMWDSSGSTSADRIRMDERTGDYEADGNVNSSRMPEKDPKKNSQVLSSDEPLQAQAQKMVSTNKNRTIHYAGSVLLWQGANRIQADTVDLDREKHMLAASGHVMTSLWQEPKDEEKKKTTPPVLTVVHAPRLIYTDQNRLAVYSGGVDLKRPGMHVTSKELQAYLADSSADSRLEKAIGDGDVKIVQSSADRVRTGTSEHGEYYTGEEKIILSGGKPRYSDTLGNYAQGSQLTYFADTGRLLVDGAANQPARSQIIRRHH